MRGTIPAVASSSMQDWMGPGSAGTSPVAVLAGQPGPADGVAPVVVPEALGLATTSLTHPSAALASSTVHTRLGPLGPPGRGRSCLDDDQAMLGHLPHRIPGALAGVAAVAHAPVGLLVGPPGRRLVDHHAEVEPAAAAARRRCGR